MSVKDGQNEISQSYEILLRYSAGSEVGKNNLVNSGESLCFLDNRT